MSLMQLLLASSAAVSGGNTVQYLVIGGGGGGGYNGFGGNTSGGGGGAGGYRTNRTGDASGGGASAESAFNITLGTNYSVTVGAGGAALTNGSDSVFGSITSLGGGAGSAASANGNSGGSGGGATAADPGSFLGGAGTANQGYAGGDEGTFGSPFPSSGGGGAGAVGGTPTSASVSGNGGTGVASTITGSSVTRAGGGGGSNFVNSGTAGAGGAGGGGNGSNSASGTAGTANTGGGGGNNASGGSGVVILRYANTLTMSNPGGGLTFSTAAVGGDTVATITAGTGNVQFNTGIVTSGLVLHLDAGNSSSYPGSGTAWTDLSGSGNNGTLTNGPTFSAADGGQIVFDGTNDYVACGNAASLQLSTLTIEAWFKAGNTNSGFRGILSKNTAWGLLLENNILVTYDFGAGASRTTGINCGDNLWRQVALVVSGGGSNNATIYVNGSAVLTTTISILNQSTELRVAANDVIAQPQHLAGSVAIARAYNRALSASEVLQNFNTNKARFGL